MAIQLQPEETNIWRIVQAIIQLVTGRHNSSGQVSLAAGTTTTTVKAPNCSTTTRPQLQARTANAALAVLTSPGVFVSSVSKGVFVITHANAATVDRTFDWIATGG